MLVPVDEEYLQRRSDGDLDTGKGEMITVVVCDDHLVVREGVVRVLTAAADIRVLAQAGDGRAALDVIRAERPDVALLDFRLPDQTGADVAARVRALGLPTRIVLLSAHSERPLVEDAMRHGASAYLSKEAGKAEIIATVRAVARGEVLSPFTAAGEVRARRDEPHVPLSPRELEVLRSIAAGRATATIAADLVLAPSTVKTLTKRLYGKLGVSDRGAAVAEGMRRKLLH